MNAGNPNNAMPDMLPLNIPAAPVIPNIVEPIMVWQDTRQRQREENLRNWNWEEVIDVDMIPDEDIIDADMIPDEDIIDADMILDEEFTDVDMVFDEELGNGLHLEDLFGLGLTDEDIMQNGVGPNMPDINAQRENTIQVLNRHRVYNILDESDLMDEDEDDE